ncbi:MAG: hypothetical protein QOE36_2114 [Gaiellaceae bacterium]|nr:hypothetical protein [Gaiellaceae bacterium]
MFVGFHWSNTATREPEHFTAGPTQTVAPEPKAVKLPQADVNAARAVAAKFVESAVLGHHAERSFDLSTANLRQGISRVEWSRPGAGLPVVPFTSPVLQVRVDPVYTYARTIGLHVGIIPTAKARVRGQVFDMELVAVGGGSARRWLVDYWAPVGGEPPPSNTPVAASGPVKDLKPGLGAGWIFAPLALIVGGILLVPLALAARGKYRNSRANRAWSQSS